MIRRLTWILLALALAARSEAATRYAETLITKASGSTNAVVMGSASVRVFEPGATTSAACSGSTISVYSNGNIADADVVEVSSTGLQFTVTSHTSTSVTVSGSPTCASGDRLLRVSSPVTIYNDQGASSTITQPATATSSGLIAFYANAAIFDLKATSSGGLKFVNFDIGTGAGSSGGWTDAGTTVHTSTSTDNVEIGGTSATARLHLVQTGSDGTSTNRLFDLESFDGTKMGWWIGDDERLYLGDVSDSIPLVGAGATTGTTAPWYFGNVTSGVGLANPGTINLHQESLAARGIVGRRSDAAASGNFVELRAENGSSVNGAISWSGNFTGQAASFTTGTFSGALTSGAAVTGTQLIASTASLSGLVVPTPGKLTINGDQYTWPTDFPSVTGRHLSSTNAGVLTWEASVTGCAGSFRSLRYRIPIVNEAHAALPTAYCSPNTSFTISDTGEGSARDYGCVASENDADFLFLPQAFVGTVSLWSATDVNVTAGSLAINLVKDDTDFGTVCTISSGARTCSGPSNLAFSSASTPGSFWSLKIVSTGLTGPTELIVTYCFGL